MYHPVIRFPRLTTLPLNGSTMTSKQILKGLALLVPNWRYARRILVVGDVSIDEITTSTTNTLKQPLEFVQADSPEDNQADAWALKAFEGERFCSVLCLDTINTRKDLDAALAELAQVNFDTCVIRINEGSRSGKGRKKDGLYQRNEKTASYVRAVSQNFHKFDVTLNRAASCIVIAKGRKFYELDDDGEV